MEEQTGTNETGAAPSASKSDGGNKLLLGGIIAGVVIINTVISFILISATKPKNDAQRAAETKADSVRLATEQMTTMGATTEKAPVEAIVNIAGTDGDRFLKAAIIFEYDDKAYPDLGEELLRRAPRFKDLLIDHLSRLTLADVTEPEAKEKIRKDLARLVNKTLPAKLGEIREVLFTTYIIQ